MTRILCLGLGLAWNAWSQLDPRLQKAGTDILDLHQMPSSAKVKPELVTLFDFSGSMQRLMYHPQYVNNDINDDGTDYFLKFRLYKGTDSVPGSNTFTIRANSAFIADSWSTYRWNGRATAAVSMTVGGSAGVPMASEERWFYHSSSRRYIWVRTELLHVPIAATPAQAVAFSARVSVRATSDNLGNVSAPMPSGLTGYGLGVVWSVVGPRASTLSPARTASDPAATQWTVPAYDPGRPGTATRVEAYLLDREGNHFDGGLTSRELIKPSGDVVTEADAQAATGTDLHGTGYGSRDVRNWVRAASHARFVGKVQVAGREVTRTVDLPIPWKIHGSSSTGSPLSSREVHDPRVTTRRSDGATHSFGSGMSIDPDTVFRLERGAQVLSGSAELCTETSLLTTQENVGTYKGPYLEWIFAGTYTDGRHAGKLVVFDAADGSVAGGQEGRLGWGRGHGAFSPSDRIWVPDHSGTGAYRGEVEVAAQLLRTPAVTRLQAVKEAAIRMWVKYQDEVLWAFRFLDPSEGGETASEGSVGRGTRIDNRSTERRASADPTASRVHGQDTGWTLLNEDSLGGMKRIAALQANGGTPLTYAMARSLAQFGDPYSVFNRVLKGESKPKHCMKHFLILFTDGVDNNGKSAAPAPTNDTCYVDQDGGSTGSALAGNRRLLATGREQVDRFGAWWNIYTFAGAAAHLSDPDLVPSGTTSKSGVDYLPGVAQDRRTGTPSTFLPFAVAQRGEGTDAVSFERPHPITTMTVGVSLGGRYTDLSSPKRRLFLAAAVGDPSVTQWNLDALEPFDTVPDPDDPTGQRRIRKPGTSFFFDAATPDRLLESLDAALREASERSRIHSTSNPNIPFIGAALGKQLYLGRFTPTISGSPIWTGDLLMFATRETQGRTEVLDAQGRRMSKIDATSAQWSAAKSLETQALRWSDRKLYTRLPQGSALVRFTDDASTSPGLQAAVATATDEDMHPLYSAEQKRDLVRFAAGADLHGSRDPGGRPLENRRDLMGDIINSAPAVVEYPLADVQDRLPAALRGHTQAQRFRLLLVGTNQGWLHAFGEVSWQEVVTTPENTRETLTRGAVAELWAFMPTELLSHLDYLRKDNVPHRYLVDGTPNVYHLDLPPQGGGQPNGLVDRKSYASGGLSERAIVIFGLRKGGRGYYALDVQDPLEPRLAWTLIPDEVQYGGLPPERNVTAPRVDDAALRDLVSRMGFSTCAPSLGRVQFRGSYRTAVFLGGGYSEPDVEAAFQKGLMGRSVLALDAHTGAILSAVDLTSERLGGSSIGPVAVGLVPFEFVLNSGCAQRAYFLDYEGSLWCWGSKAVAQDGPMDGFRVDALDLARWTSDGTTGGAPGIRRVFQDRSGGGLYSTLPVPVRLNQFPGAAKPGRPAPAAVAVAMVSGDRNNPLDHYVTLAEMPTRHALTVVFDRQDSRLWGFDTEQGPDRGLVRAPSGSDDLMNATGFEVSASSGSPCQQPFLKRVTPGCEDYYLNPKSPEAISHGFYIQLPDRVAPSQPDAPPSNPAKQFLPKGINTPSIVAGSVFYSVFTPDAMDVCKGGSGTTRTYRIANLLSPLERDTRPNILSPSGAVGLRFAGIASDFFIPGTRGVIQSGVVAGPVPSGKPVEHHLEVATLETRKHNRHPKTRVWRTVY